MKVSTIPTMLMVGVAVLVLAVSAVPAGAVDVRFNAFADITGGINIGERADADDYRLEKDFGLGRTSLNVNDGFGIVGTDFVVTADLTKNLVYQAEINLQVGRAVQSDIEVDFERMYIDYRINDAFNIQAGLYFTPIGYHNRFLYSRAWLTHSIQVNELFEEELNLMPTHTVGINLHGEFEAAGETFKYALGVGNGRKDTPVEVAYQRFSDTFETTVLLEWHADTDNPLIVGVSGFTSDIKTHRAPGLGVTADKGDLANVRLREFGFQPYVTYFGDKFNVLVEGSIANLHTIDGPTARKNVGMGGITAEFSGNMLKNKLHPYIRYDRTWLPKPSDDPYYGLRSDGDELTQHFIPEINAGMVGVSYDFNAHSRGKAEVIHHFDGAREKWGLAIQFAFGF